MIKKIILALAIATYSIQASEIKLNLPFAVYHTDDRGRNNEWNEDLLDDGFSGGISYMKDFVGVSYNTVAKNNFGNNRSHFATIDIMPKLYEDDLTYIRVGGSLGVATGFTELNNSGVIPYASANVEGGIGNFSLQFNVTPPYGSMPTAVSGIAKFKLYEW